MSEVLLQTSRLEKRYGAVTVLDEVSIDVRGGEIHGLLGANGAGKSTLCKIIAGLIAPSAGSMLLEGGEYRPSNKQEAERRGVEIVQQELNLIPTLSVAENLYLSNLPARGGIIRRWRLRADARALLDRFGLHDVDAETPVSALGVGTQQMVEIAAALGRDCGLMILDEPTAALSNAEADRLFVWLNELRERGVGMIYISHRLEEVSQLADRITVLRDGKLVCTRDANLVTTDEMVGLMTGDTGSTKVVHSFQSHAATEVALRVEGISRDPVQETSFVVHRGERLGIAGLVGSGRTELLRAIFGADVATSGHVQVAESGVARRFRSPHSAVAAGLAMVTEDRKQNGLLLWQSIRVNTTLCSLHERFSRWGVIRQRAEHQATTTQCDSLETRCASVEQLASTLSGGNQQKVAVAKWLVRDAAVFLFDEPTRGIDVAARRRIYRLIEALAAEGKGIVIVSSDLEELLETCDRIAVMSAGRLVATFDREEFSEEKIMQAAFSNYRTPGETSRREGAGLK